VIASIKHTSLSYVGMNHGGKKIYVTFSGGQCHKTFLGIIYDRHIALSFDLGCAGHNVKKIF
jgi:hypothetical protein